MNNKRRTVLSISVLSLAVAILAFSLLNQFKLHWLPDRAPLDICFWAVLCVAYAFNVKQWGGFVKGCVAFAIALLGFGVASIFAAFPATALSVAHVLCFADLAAICLTSIVARQKEKRGKDNTPEEE